MNVLLTIAAGYIILVGLLYSCLILGRPSVRREARRFGHPKVLNLFRWAKWARLSC